MARRRFKIVDGKAVEITRAKSWSGHSVHEDTIDPLRHPVTGKMYTSKSQYIKDTHAMGLRIAGNDLQSEKPMQLQDRITDDVILDRIHKAEAIQADPAKRAEYQFYENQARERHERLIAKRAAFSVDYLQDRLRD